MFKRRFPKRLFYVVAFLGLVILYTATRGNVRWRVQHHYPTAEVYFSPVNSPDPSFGGLWRSFGLRYFSCTEPVGIRISGHPTPIDFTHFRGMCISYLTLQNCIITDINPLLSEYRPEVSFVACDLSRLPDDQKHFLSYQPEFDRYSINGLVLQETVPKYHGYVGLHSERFYP